MVFEASASQARDGEIDVDAQVRRAKAIHGASMKEAGALLPFNTSFAQQGSAAGTFHSPPQLNPPRLPPFQACHNQCLTLYTTSTQHSSFKSSD